MIFRTIQNLSERTVLAILLSVAIGTSVLSAMVHVTLNQSVTLEWGEGWLQNFSTEMFGALFTFLLLERIVGARQQREAEQRKIEQEKQNLIIQMRSEGNAIAKNAVRQLRARGWLEDGSLQGLDFRDANLQGAKLRDANLQNVSLKGADLRKASLVGANLQDADLEAANLEGAELRRARLQGAYLENANLQGADVDAVELDKDTILPNGVNYNPEAEGGFKQLLSFTRQ